MGCNLNDRRCIPQAVIDCGFTASPLCLDFKISSRHKTNSKKATVALEPLEQKNQAPELLPRPDHISFYIVTPAVLSTVDSISQRNTLRRPLLMQTESSGVNAVRHESRLAMPIGLTRFNFQFP
jgi:hypothetical protein